MDRIRRLASDPDLVEQTVAAAREAWEARGPELDAELGRLAKDRARLERERANLITAIGDGGPTSLTARVGDLDADLAALDERVQAARLERERLTNGSVDADEVRRLLADWDRLWSAMLLAERQRVVALLAPCIAYDGLTGTVTIAGHEPFRIRAERAPEPPKVAPDDPRRGDRGARQLALAYAIERWVADGTARDHAHAAALLGVTRARVAQITALARLSPAIQARLLAGECIHERRLRAAARLVDWSQQAAALQGKTR